MTNEEITALYKQAYCAKEAGLLSWGKKLVDPVIKWATPKLHMPGNFFTNVMKKGRGDLNLPKHAWNFAKKHPIIGIGAAGAGGWYGYNQLSNYYDTKKKEHPLYKIGEWVKENPGLVTALAAGAITSPLWLPPTLNYFLGNKNQGEGMQLGAARDRYQMGYYPGRV